MPVNSIGILPAQVAEITILPSDTRTKEKLEAGADIITSLLNDYFKSSQKAQMVSASALEGLSSSVAAANFSPLPEKPASSFIMMLYSLPLSNVTRPGKAATILLFARRRFIFLYNYWISPAARSSGVLILTKPKRPCLKISCPAPVQPVPGSAGLPQQN